MFACQVRSNEVRRGSTSRFRIVALQCVAAEVVGVFNCSSESTSSSTSSSSTPSSICCPCFASSRALYFLLFFFIELAFLFFFNAFLIASRLCSPFSNASTFAARISFAIFWFWDRERVACDFTTMPVGLWMSWTAEFVLFFHNPHLLDSVVDEWGGIHVRSFDHPVLSLSGTSR